MLGISLSDDARELHTRASPEHAHNSARQVTNSGSRSGPAIDDERFAGSRYSASRNQLDCILDIDEIAGFLARPVKLNGRRIVDQFPANIPEDLLSKLGTVEREKSDDRATQTVASSGKLT
jgi:hypothetical protein